MPFSPGDEVHVAALGKGTVREVRRGGRYLVELKGRSLLVDEAQLISNPPPTRRRARAALSSPVPSRDDVPTSLDLHGMTVDEALLAIDSFISDALLAGHAEIRLIHGRSGGHIKSAVHGRLKELPVVREFRVDTVNAGVTIVVL